MRLLDVLVPARCVACGAGERLLCAVCRGSLRLLGPPLCARCGLKLERSELGETICACGH